MKVGILTFQFAYNYGAMLQAFALRTALIKQGCEVDVVPYYPENFKKAYSIDPFESKITFKHRVYNLITYMKRYKQALKFDQFKFDNLYSTSYEFGTTEELIQYLCDYSLLVCGSDQIWNDSITGNTDAYFGAGADIRKIAYAASLGTKKLSAVQKININKHISEFSYVSVRESSSSVILSSYYNDVEVVCDPVFLLSKNEWEIIEKSINVEDKYLLLYLLEDNIELVRCAFEYAHQNGLIIYEIHPTLSSHHSGCIELKNVGPQEFVYLVDHAQCVCTNSFHAVSFSVIFRKKLIHIPNSHSPERTESLLSIIGIDLSQETKHHLYDLEKLSYEELNKFVLSSKEYLSCAIANQRIKELH